MTRYRARWLCNGDRFSRPIPHAVIEIRDQHIHNISQERKEADIDLGQVAIVPGLINAHTHLEFSSIQQPLQPLDEFPGWVRSVVDWRRSQSSGPFEAIQAGLKESIQSGVTTVGEIATTDWRENKETLSEVSPRRVVMFREFLGLADEAVDSQLQIARDFLNRSTSNHFIPALSPHAPYSVHPDLFDGLCELAAERNVPVAFHLAESPAEMQLLHDGTGPMVDFLQTMGVYRPELFEQRQTPLNILKRLDRGFPVLIVHGNFLFDEEIEYLSRRKHMSVVYCPRTYESMQGGDYPWRKMLAADVNVVIGTDSRASNPDLSIWNELRFLQRQASILTGERILAMATSNAAQALGLVNTGQLVAGHTADLCIVQLDDPSIEDPQRFLFRDQSRPIAVMQAGEWTIPPRSLSRD